MAIVNFFDKSGSPTPSTSYPSGKSYLIHANLAYISPVEIVPVASSGKIRLTKISVQNKSASPNIAVVILNGGLSYMRQLVNNGETIHFYQIAHKNNLMIYLPSSTGAQDIWVTVTSIEVDAQNFAYVSEMLGSTVSWTGPQPITAQPASASKVFIAGMDQDQYNYSFGFGIAGYNADIINHTVILSKSPDGGSTFYELTRFNVPNEGFSYNTDAFSLAYGEQFYIELAEPVTNSGVNVFFSIREADVLPA